MKKKFLSFMIVASNLICCVCNFNIVSANDNIKNAYANILKTYIGNQDIYCIYDIDKNGTPELIVKSGTCEADYYYHYYTFSNGNATKIVDRRGIHVQIYSNPSGNGILEWWSHQGCSIVTLVTLNNGSLSEQQVLQSNDWNLVFEMESAFPGCKSLEGEYDTSYDYYKCNYVNDLSHLNEWFNNNSRSKSKIAKPSYTIDSVSQSTSSAATYGSIYENITTEVLQIQSYISKKMYLEATSLCNKVLNTRKISDADINLLNEYKNSAQTAYKAYVDNLNKNKTTQYYISDWGMSYKFFDMYKPEIIGKYDYDDVLAEYNPDAYISICDGICLSIRKIGSKALNSGYNEVIIYNPQQALSLVVNNTKALVWQSAGQYTFECLSETDIKVNGINAKQVTYRTYGAPVGYQITRLISFQRGNFIYLIEAREESYLWSDDFWNKMELVRNSISFY